MNEAERKALFLTNPMVLGFLATMMEDAQMTEGEEALCDEREERDIGTIYTCPESTLRAVIAECAAFALAIAHNGDLTALLDCRHTSEHIGSDLYLERAGHGVGFRDRTIWDDDREENDAIGAALSGAVPARGTLETYIGDDGGLYICGSENA